MSGDQLFWMEIGMFVMAISILLSALHIHKMAVQLFDRVYNFAEREIELSKDDTHD